MKILQKSIPIYRLKLVKTKGKASEPIQSPEDAAKAFMDMANADREQMEALFLNVRNEAIGRHLIAVGTLNANLAHPREVFKAAILANAAKLILLHNHPSGNPGPSDQDHLVTKRMAKAGELLGIELEDHIILSPTGRLYSFREQNRLPSRLDDEKTKSYDYL
jgi:DNA repair protein RadC